MYGVTELVEECFHLVHSEQCWGIGCGACEVAGDGRDGGYAYAVFVALRTVARTPCAYALAAAGIHVENNGAEVRAVLVEHFVYAAFVAVYGCAP